MPDEEFGSFWAEVVTDGFGNPLARKITAIDEVFSNQL
jgi:hypothetical protein